MMHSKVTQSYIDVNIYTYKRICIYIYTYM